MSMFNFSWFKSKKKQKELEEQLREEQRHLELMQGLKAISDLVAIKKADENVISGEEIGRVLGGFKETGKPYRSFYSSFENLNVVFWDGEVISVAIPDAEKINKVRNASTKEEIIEILLGKIVAVKPEPIKQVVEPEVKYEEEMEEFFEEEENRKELPEDLEWKNNGVYMKDIDLEMPMVIVDEFIGSKNNKEKYEALKYFWMWCATNPIEASRRDLFGFIKKFSVKITSGGLLALYRRVVSIDKSPKPYVTFVSSQYAIIKKRKKSPKNYKVIKTVKGEYSLRDSNKENDGDLVGNLFELYQTLSNAEENLFTDAHTGKFEIKVGSVYKIDEKEVDLNNRVDCSTGLHVAAKEYNYNSFGDTPVLCLVNPAKVRSVPVDGGGKMRVSEMFIASVLVDGKGNQVDADTNLIPMNEEYFNISLKELEAQLKDKQFRNAVKLKQPKLNDTPLPQIELKVVETIKDKLKKRIVLV